MKRAITIIVLISFSFWLHAEVLIIERINNTKQLDIPTKGLSMSQVTQRFGEPLVKNTAIGEPPITKWKYSNFTVYFEHSWVISSVINKASPNEIGPKKITQ